MQKQWATEVCALDLGLVIRQNEINTNCVRQIAVMDVAVFVSVSVSAGVLCIIVNEL